MALWGKATQQSRDIPEPILYGDLDYDFKEILAWLF